MVKMTRMIKLAFYLSLTVAGLAIIFAQQKKPDLRKVYDDQISVLHTSQESDNKQEYLLSGSTLGLAAGLTFTGKTPTEARISLASGKSLSVQSVGDRFVTKLFQAAKNGEIIVLYDLDTNGSWDARTSRFGKCAVFFNGEWHDVSKMEGILSGIPQANVDGVKYEFSKGIWRPSVEGDHLK
jgi:hypothetical protein